MWMGFFEPGCIENDAPLSKTFYVRNEYLEGSEFSGGIDVSDSHLTIELVADEFIDLAFVVVFFGQ